MKLLNDAYRYKNITFLLRKHSFVIAICATVYTKENKAVSTLRWHFFSISFRWCHHYGSP